MKFVFCSNYMNHHQLYLSEALIREGVEYRFIASEKIEEERKQGGWKDMNEQYDWIVRAYESEEQLEKALKLIDDADLVISGSFPMRYIKKRILSNRPVFLYSERWFKTNDGDISRFKNLRNYLSNLLHRKYLNFFKVYMLCASAYTAYDCSLYGNFKNKCYQWGYFPRTETHDIDRVIAAKKSEKVKFLWVGRLINWKHPEIPIELAQRLKNAGYDFNLEIIGVGDRYDSLKEKISAYGLNDNVELTGTVNNEEVLKRMEKADMFLITSDYNEGWGAVLNEAMNSGCAVIASHAIGSAPFLIEHGKNGFMFQNGNVEDLCRIAKTLIDDPLLRQRIAKSAYLTITDEWNAEIAAQKLIGLYENLINKKPISIKSGICSPAPILNGADIESILKGVKDR